MKIGKLGSEVKTIIQPLERLGATESAKTLNCLYSLFDELKDIDAEAFSTKARAIHASGDSGPSIQDVRDTLNAAMTFMNAVSASAAKRNKIQTAVNCFEGVPNELSFRAFAHEIKAVLLIDVVKFYLESLQANLGRPGFDSAFAALEKDSRVNKAKLAEITMHFVTRTGTSASKPQMLKRIYARHANLVDIAKKNEWQRGKTAA